MRLLFPGLTLLLLVVGCGESPVVRQEQALPQVNRLADELDQRTNEAGVYQRVTPPDIHESDPWGRKLDVTYSQGGVAEMVRVRSAGPDRNFDTHDDIAAERMSANWKGIGQGIKDNIEETAANAARGVVRGGIDGLKESVK